MPRLTDRDYLFVRTYLHEAWRIRRQAFSLILPRDQYYLHRYFRLSDDLSEPMVLSHRRTISAEQPSLPQCAGRALKELANPKSLKQAVGSKRIVLYPLVRPEPDVSRLLSALLAIAKQGL